MSPQSDCMRRCKVTLVASVWLYSTVHFQMCPQNICPRRCIVALVALVWLFSAVRFYMYPQIACPRRCIVALVAFVWLFSTVHFQMSPQITCMRRDKVITLVAFVWIFPTVDFQRLQPLLLFPLLGVDDVQVEVHNRPSQLRLEDTKQLNQICMNSFEENKKRFEMCQIRITILSLITLSLFWIQDYSGFIKISTDYSLS